MIAKCVALLAVVAQINGYVCNSNCATGIVGSSLVGSGVVGSGLVGSGIVGSGVVGSGALASATVSSRNIVAKGKYPVALENNGPVPDCRVPVSSSHVQAPVQEKPTVRLPSKIPAPRTVAHSCTCFKQILRPRVHDQYITVPTVQRYIETIHKPVVENIQYEAVPVNCGSSCGSAVSQLTSSALPVVSSVGQAVPVSAAVEAYPVSTGYDVSGVQALPVSTGCGVSGVQALPVSTGCGISGVQALPVSTGYGISGVQALPVSTGYGVSGVQALPVSTGCGISGVQALPVSTGYGVSGVQALPVSTGCGVSGVQAVPVSSGCGCQGYY